MQTMKQILERTQQPLHLPDLPTIKLGHRFDASHPEAAQALAAVEKLAAEIAAGNYQRTGTSSASNGMRITAKPPTAACKPFIAISWHNMITGKVAKRILVDGIWYEPGQLATVPANSYANLIRDGRMAPTEPAEPEATEEADAPAPPDLSETPPPRRGRRPRGN